jgi:hypothetical protein
MRERSIDGTVVRVYVMSTLENLNASHIPDLLQAFSGTIARAQHVGKDVLLTFAQDDSPLRSRLISMSNRTARLFVRNRSIVMTMEKPASEAYVVEPGENPILPRVTQIV